MLRLEKTVFLSYRRADAGWALALYGGLRQRGFDVFFDYRGIGSGAFGKFIVESIHARAHFLVLLTPNALDRCTEPGDWMRREIEEALEGRRNIVPLIMPGFSFQSPNVRTALTGKLAALSSYNGLDLMPSFFEEGLERLERQYLSVPVEMVLHPISDPVAAAVRSDQAAADSAIPRAGLPPETTAAISLPPGPVSANGPLGPTDGSASATRVSVPLARRPLLWVLTGGALALPTYWIIKRIDNGTVIPTAGRPIHPVRIPSIKAPRFISLSTRQRRADQRISTVKVGARSSLVYSDRKKGRLQLKGKFREQLQVTLHFADRSGMVRLLSHPRSSGHFVPLAPTDALDWIIRTKSSRRPGKAGVATVPIRMLPLGTERSWVWECLALDHIESNRLDTACSILSTGIQHALLTAKHTPLNLRLFDLLAGLSVRLALEEKFLQPMLRLLDDRLQQMKLLPAYAAEFGAPAVSRSTTLSTKAPAQAVAIEPAKHEKFTTQKARNLNKRPLTQLISRIEQRLKKWRSPDSKWHQTWKNKLRPIWWHHPFETRNWSQKTPRITKRPVKTPERRQRPVRIS